MSQRKWSNVYAFVCVLLMIAGYVALFLFAIKGEVLDGIRAIVGVVLGIVFAPVFHELGHILFAKMSNFSIIYSKFFCFKLTRKGKRLRFSFSSPFAPDETQAVPNCGGNMYARARAYTLGGLLFGGIFLFVVLLISILLTVYYAPNYLFFGMLPYALYLFILNVLPFEYPMGKTDMAVALGLRRGDDVEKTMLSAMEIQGELFLGKSYSEIEETLYFNLPQLSEEEPLFFVILDLKYRFYLDKNDLKNAADCLNRLVMSQDYFLDEEREKLAAECVYMHSIQGDLEKAEECGKLCANFLRTENVTAKRVLATFSSAFGKCDAVPVLKEQANKALSLEFVAGNAKFEKGLLDRIGCE